MQSYYPYQSSGTKVAVRSLSPPPTPGSKGFRSNESVQSSAQSISSFGDSFMCGVEEIATSLERELPSSPPYSAPSPTPSENETKKSNSARATEAETFESSQGNFKVLKKDIDGSVLAEPIPRWIKWLTGVSLCLLCSAVAMITVAVLLSGASNDQEVSRSSTGSDSSSYEQNGGGSIPMPVDTTNLPPSLPPAASVVKSSPSPVTAQPSLRPFVTAPPPDVPPPKTTAPPSISPTGSPSLVTALPTTSPSSLPTASPTVPPTVSPTGSPTEPPKGKNMNRPRRRY